MATLYRDVSSASEKVFDLLVIGGGINGAAIAWDAALRGFSTVLLEKSDFGSAASAGCFKIAHGGLRYLQHIDITRLRESAEEQRILRIIAPHLVHPLPFLVPCYGLGMKSRPVLKTGLLLYELLAGRRNRGVDQDHILPGHRLISKEHCLRLAPGLDPDGLAGGMLYYDCQMSACERLTLAVVQAAAAAGAHVFNYLQAVKLNCCPSVGGKESVDHVTARDLTNSREYEFRAKVVINAAGPWVDRVLGLCTAPVSPLTRGYHSAGIQVITRQFINGSAVAVESRYRDRAAVVSRGGRSFFIHPWRGCSLIGTSDAPFSGDPDDFKIRLDDIKQFINDAAKAYKCETLVPVNAQFAFGGLRPIDERDERTLESGAELPGETRVRRKDIIVDHNVVLPDGSLGTLDNLISVIGVKYTTFRRLAEQVVNLASQKLTGKKLACKTAATPLAGGEIDNLGRFISAQVDRCPVLPQHVVRHLVLHYGSAVEEIFRIIEESADYNRPAADGSDVYLAEVVHAARHEMVCKLSDIILRRTGLGTLGYPGERALRRTAAAAGAQLGWDRARTEQEVQETMELFRFA